MSHYLVVPEISVRNANAQPAWWIIGPPPVTAYMGFAHAFGRHLEARPDGVAIVHHDIQFLGENINGSFRPAQFRSASFIDKDDYSSKNPYVLSSQPTARCHLSVSLVLRFSEDLGIPENRFASFLRGRKLAGGDIVKYGSPELMARKWDPEEVVRFLQKNVRRSSWSLADRSDLMVRAPEDRDPLDTLLRVTRRFRKPETDREGSEDSDGTAWLMPTTVGYAEISERKSRRNLRGDLPHAYAEPLVGLVQYQSLRTNGLHFWSPTFPMPGVYLTSALSH